MTERMAPMQRKETTITPQRTALPQVRVPVDPLAVHRRAVQTLTHRPVAAQRQLVQAVLRAADLSQQEVSRVEQAQAPLQRQVAELFNGLPEQAYETALQRHAVQAPTRPQSPSDWVTVMRMRAHTQSLEAKKVSH
jgi:hypothetical protein